MSPSGKSDTCDGLLLLSTHGDLTVRLFTTTGMTSGAAAQAARMAGSLMGAYPEFWPETVRGLLVHSADWTGRMLSQVTGVSDSKRALLLLRRYGYGVPDLNRAHWSANNALTLVAQESLTPFGEPRSKSSRPPTKDMHVHSLPWPKAALQALGETPVELRITLSYFIEPNPARRGWKHRHLYRSLGLRFALKGETERLDDFRARMSKDAQQDDYTASKFSDPGWTLGAQHRNRGSVHSDRWSGIAADLAERGHIGIHPVGGWWRERPHLERWKSRTLLLDRLDFDAKDGRGHLHTRGQPGRSSDYDPDLISTAAVVCIIGMNGRRPDLGKAQSPAVARRAEDGEGIRVFNVQHAPVIRVTGTWGSDRRGTPQNRAAPSRYRRRRSRGRAGDPHLSAARLPEDGEGWSARLRFDAGRLANARVALSMAIATVLDGIRISS